ncbi:MAG: hypothetical protein J6K74_00540 [Marinifilaceae bacterium]|nr:hypothetical protein [Marinifilaceae bacterium]
MGKNNKNGVGDVVATALGSSVGTMVGMVTGVLVAEEVFDTPVETIDDGLDIQDDYISEAPEEHLVDGQFVDTTILDVEPEVNELAYNDDYINNADVTDFEYNA